MQVETVGTIRDNTLLPALRALLEHADEAILCVAFVSEAGVNLIRPLLRRFLLMRYAATFS